MSATAWRTAEADPRVDKVDTLSEKCKHFFGVQDFLRRFASRTEILQ
jgi:hypothetical protein